LILITGAGGFLGRHLLQELCLQEAPVRALYHSRKPELLPGQKNIHWEKCDLLDVCRLEELMQGITEVYHCAAIVSFDSRKKQQMIRDNTAITANVVNAALAADVRKMVHVSSVAALGRPLRKGVTEKLLIHEDIPWENSKSNTAYAESKYLSELEVWRGIAEGLNAVIINPSTILGAGDWSKGSSHLMQIADREFPWFTKGINAWVDVEDVVSAMLLLMNSDIQGERFIISSGNFPYKAVFTKMAEALQRRPPHRKAGKWMTELVWRLELLKSRLAGKEATISKESARIAQSENFYDNGKFLGQFPSFQYHSLEEAIAGMAKAYRE
jgi:nucleoside-diphosphate-sugar epimerase